MGFFLRKAHLLIFGLLRFAEHKEGLKDDDSTVSGRTPQTFGGIRPSGYRLTPSGLRAPARRGPPARNPRRSRDRAAGFPLACNLRKTGFAVWGCF